MLFRSPDVEAHFKKLSAKYGFSIVPPEELMNSFAYQLLGAGKKDEAIAAFKLNVERHPDSANVYDSLGEAYEHTYKFDLPAAHYEHAVENYERAVQLGTKNNDPNLPVYRAHLEAAMRGLNAVKDMKERAKTQVQ